MKYILGISNLILECIKFSTLKREKGIARIVKRVFTAVFNTKKILKSYPAFLGSSQGNLLSSIAYLLYFYQYRVASPVAIICSTQEVVILCQFQFFFCSFALTITLNCEPIHP